MHVLVHRDARARVIVDISTNISFFCYVSLFLRIDFQTINLMCVIQFKY